MADFDQITDLVLPKLSAQFLDRALAQRLETVDARSLVNALARAERLGYDVSDIVVERMPDKPEQVVPSLQGVMPPDFAPTNGQFSEAPAQQLPAQEKQAAATFMSAPTKPGQPNWLAGLPPVPREGPGGIHYCSECRRPCSAFSALQYVSSVHILVSYYDQTLLGKVAVVVAPANSSITAPKEGSM